MLHVMYSLAHALKIHFPVKCAVHSAYSKTLRNLIAILQPRLQVFSHNRLFHSNNRQILFKNGLVVNVPRPSYYNSLCCKDVALGRSHGFGWS